MSEFEENIEGLLMQAFPQATIKSQYLVRYMGQELFFDFYIPSMNLLIECQGQQHYKFVPHFHGSQSEFKKYAWRDSLKREWANKEKIFLYEIPYNKQPSTAAELFNEVYERMDL
jgi:hypothetical protein